MLTAQRNRALSVRNDENYVDKSPRTSATDVKPADERYIYKVSVMVRNYTALHLRVHDWR